MRLWTMLAVVVASLLAATPAAADWQWTKWGMTPSEVVSASDGKAKQTSPTILTILG
ncbi:MAG: hypothetical protein HY859_06950, partial [Caulobacterales bacterium]|nr:hypothetical protein [Caulobacterales bacterium]